MIENLKSNLAEIGDLFKILSPIEIDVLLDRYGFTGKAKTLQAVGDRLKVSRERVRQIEERALDKMQIIINYKT